MIQYLKKMRLKNKGAKWSRFIVAGLMASTLLASCSNDDKQVTAPKGAYSNGFFMLNEGWFQNEAGSVHFYNYGADTINKNVYAKENDGALPTISSATLENGIIIADQLFLISKAGGPIIVASPTTLKKIGQMTMDGSDFRSMAAIDDHTAVVSSNNAIYTIDLKGLSINTEPVFTGKNISNLFVSGGYLLASDDGGVDIIDLKDWSLIRHFDGVTEGYVKTPDGKIYGAEGKLLVGINPVAKDSFQVALNQPIWQNEYGYNAPSIVSSSKENAVFYVAGPDFSATKIYKYIKDNPASLAMPFISLPAGESFYGKGLGYDKRNDQIITWSITGYTESDNNFLRFYNASTGELVKTITYGHPYFLANLVFYP